MRGLQRCFSIVKMHTRNKFEVILTSVVETNSDPSDAVQLMDKISFPLCFGTLISTPVE
jgi:hypothetical protein